MENIVVIEKRRKLGEINGENIFVWELHEVMRISQFEEWCMDRGYTAPYLSEKTNRNLIDTNLEATLWNVDERA